MVAIDVDFDVFKALTIRRKSEQMTENEVIRRLLGLEAANDPKGSEPPTGLAWVVKNVSFPHGTLFRAAYKGREYTGVVKNGSLVVEGQRFKSPSAAAVSITNSPVNGWRFWECKFPNSEEWRCAATLRK